MWDVTYQKHRKNTIYGISTHTSRVGCDNPSMVIDISVINFYSHIPCGMWHYTYYVMILGMSISTHTSRVGCDSRNAFSCSNIMQFLLTHPVWDVTKIGLMSLTVDRFLLTHPVWDVTGHFQWRFTMEQFLLTHPVWDVTWQAEISKHLLSYFYSHIPCGMWPPVA